MKLFKATRYNEWWEYKLIPFLSIGYTTIIFADIVVADAIWTILFLVGAIAIGAVYVSVINDLSDIDEDAKAEKPNRMAAIPPVYRTPIIITCLLTGLFFGFFIYPDINGVLCYSLSWIAFSLYSLPPFRLKKRGLWGPLCDAAGAHFFPTLLITFHLLYLNKIQISANYYIPIGIWALFYGLRGILLHQFHDRDNDIKSKTRTYVSSIQPAGFKTTEAGIFTIESIAFLFMLSYVWNIWLALAFVLYIALVMIRKFDFKYAVCLIIPPKNAPYQLLMNDFYLVFFPLALLFTIVRNYDMGWIVLLLHITLFPIRILHIVKEYIIFGKNVIKGILLNHKK